MTQVFGYTPTKVEDGEQYVRFVAIYDDGDAWEFQVRDGAGKLNTVKVPSDAIGWLAKSREPTPDAAAETRPPSDEVPSGLKWLVAAGKALDGHERDYGEVLPSDMGFGRIPESQDSASFVIRVGHIRQAVDAIRELSSQTGDATETRPQAAVWRHIKRGTLYTEIARANLQQASQFGPVEGDNIVVYRGEDGKLWARAVSEFEDGRFEHVPSPDTANPTSDEPKPFAWATTFERGGSVLSFSEGAARSYEHGVVSVQPLFTSPPSNKKLVEALISALERLNRDARNMLAGKPVRNFDETLAEVDAALKSGGQERG